MNKLDKQVEDQLFIKVSDVPLYEPSLKVGGMRLLIQFRDADLRRDGVICNFGRKLLVNLPKLRQWIAAGHASHISGRAS